MSLILTQPQAEAVFSAMCALNNVGGRIDVTWPDHGRVIEDAKSFVFVFSREGVVLEKHVSQAAFATAYGLDHGGEISTDTPKQCPNDCAWVDDPQPDNAYQSKCRRCGNTMPF